MAHDVFVSHSNKDRAVTEQVCRALREAGYDYWVSYEDIPVSASFPGAITRAIRDVPVMVVVLTEHSNRSEHVTREVVLAFENQPPTAVVVFYLGDVRYNDDLQYYMTKTHRLTASDPPTEEDFRRLVETVRAILLEGGGARGPRAETRAASPPPARTPADVPSLKTEPPAVTTANVAADATRSGDAGNGRQGSRNAMLLGGGALLAVAVIGVIIGLAMRGGPGPVQPNTNRPPNLNGAPNRNAATPPANQNSASPATPTPTTPTPAATPTPQTQPSPSASPGLVKPIPSAILTALIQRRVKHSLSKIPGLSEVTVEVEGTVVTLGGVVYSQNCRQAATRLTNEQIGVTEIRDKMSQGRSLLPEKIVCQE